MGLRSMKRYAGLLLLAVATYSVLRKHVFGLYLPGQRRECDAGQYFDNIAQTCVHCTGCNPEETMVRPCTASANTLCSRCQASRFLSMETRLCTPCATCPAGMIARLCTGSEDTQCSMEEGTGFHDTTDDQHDAKLITRATGLPPPLTAEEQARKGREKHARPLWQTASAPRPAAGFGEKCDPSHLTKECVEDGWGAKCYSADNMDVLVALPYDSTMKPALIQLMFKNLVAMECANEGFNLHLGLYDKPFNNSMDAQKTKLSGRTILATIRNVVIHECAPLP
jgi:hypothetical protein